MNKGKTLQKLPVGIQTFSEIREPESNYIYIDKTELIWELTESGKQYFLSRPRRFGKSLLVDTLKELFEANKSLFKDLYIENKWNWDISYPVLKISFGGGVTSDRLHLEDTLNAMLNSWGKHFDISYDNEAIHLRFQEIIKKIHEKTEQKVVILIDEYDKPILDQIDNTNVALGIREGLKNFYSVIKDSDAHVRFVFLTGVSKFSKVNLFSGLNNLTDMTIMTKYSSLCGYTQKDLETSFAPYLKDQDWAEIKTWYNGYSWLGESVYNPYDVLLFIENNCDYRNYWFETGNPSFLIKLLEKKSYYLPNLECIDIGSDILGEFDVENIELVTLLFQTGYLTLTGTKKRGVRTTYVLGFPNLEVRYSFSDYLISYLTKQGLEKSQIQDQVYGSLEQNDFVKLEQTLKSLFAAIPYNNFTNNQIYKYEGYYASVMYSYFASLGLELVAEDVTNKGRVDLTLKFPDGKVYLFEFKVVELCPEEGKALQQLKDKKYHEKYMSEPGPIYLIGIDFSRKERNLVGFEWEMVAARD
jgi:hypothetical protein